MPHPHLRVERNPAGYRRLLLARPQQHNALDVGLARALRDAFAEDLAEPVVLGSTEPRVFCAGADLTMSDADRSIVSDLLYDCYEVVVTRPGPVIAAVGGPAVGGGAQLVAAADVRIAGPAARLRWAGPPGLDLAVGAWVLPELVGRGLGLVSQVTAEPLQAAASLAADLVARGPGAAAKAKMIMTTGGLLDRLHAEKRANQSAWAQALTVGLPEATP